MQKKIIEISTNYNLTNILEKTSKLNEKIDLKIGFLGEFSSGKSTLINALLNQKVLPSMDKPTSKSVIEIVAKNNLDSLEFYELKENEKQKISAMDFSDIALSNGNSKAMIEVPSNDFFEDGYIMIDTPGISSLDESDTDITYGYLPFLDCAVICNHIQKGSLTQSIIDFLLKDEIKPIINNLLFVITNAHAKAPKAQEKIQEEIVGQLEGLNRKHSLGMKNIETKVIIVSALEAMEGKKAYSLDVLKKSFNDNFIAKKEMLLNERVSKELTKISTQLLEALIYKQEHSKLDLSELKEQEKSIEDSITKLSTEKKEILNSLNSINPKIEKTISSLLTSYLQKMKTIKDSENISILMQEMSTAIEVDVNKVISKHFKDLKLSNGNTQKFTELDAVLHDLLKQIDMGKDIGMVVLIELLTLGTAGVGGVFGFFLRSGSKMLLEQQKESNLKETAKFVNRVNPLEFIGDKIGETLIEKKISSKVENLSTEITEQIQEELNEVLHNNVFSVVEEKLNNNQLMLNQLYKDKSEKFEAFNKHTGQLNDDILELQLMLKA